MNVLSLIPDSDAIPVPWEWFRVLLLVTFFCHLILMNITVGGGIIAVWYGFFPNSNPDKYALVSPVIKKISQTLPITMAFTINLGVAPLLFLQVLYGHFFYSSSIMMAVYWLSVIFVLVIAYYLIYIYKFRYDEYREMRAVIIALSVAMLLYIAFVFVNNMSLMITPTSWFRYFHNPDGTLLNTSSDMFFPRYFHIVTGIIASGGLFAAYLTLKLNKNNDPGWAMNWFAWFTVIQFGLGFWLLLSMPRKVYLLFLGESALHSAMFVGGLLSSVAAMCFGFNRKVYASIVTTMSAFAFMVIMRDLVRNAHLSPYFTLDKLSVKGPDYSSMILFFAALLGGIILILYALRLAAKPQSLHKPVAHHQN